MITRLANSKSVQTIVDNVSTAVQRLAPVFMGAVTAVTWLIDLTADGLNTINAAFDEHSVLVKGALTAVSMALGYAGGISVLRPAERLLQLRRLRRKRSQTGRQRQR